MSQNAGSTENNAIVGSGVDTANMNGNTNRQTSTSNDLPISGTNMDALESAETLPGYNGADDIPKKATHLANQNSYQESSVDALLQVAECAADRKKIPQARRKKARERWERTIRGAMVATKFAHVLVNRRQTYVHVDEEGNIFFLIKLLFGKSQSRVCVFVLLHITSLNKIIETF